MTLDRKNGIVLWHQIEDVLTAEITDGQMAPGDQLPSESELMSRFGVSRFTVRQAMARMESKELVRVEQGRGTFVHGGVVKYEISQRTRFSRNLIEQGFDPGQEHLMDETIAATDKLALALRLKPKTNVYHRRGLAKANGAPVAVFSSYFPIDRFPDIGRVRRQHKTLTAMYVSYGIKDYVRLFTRIEARSPTPEEARLLRQHRSLPVIEVTKIDGVSEEDPISLSQSVWRADRVVFTIGNDPFAT